MQIRVDVFSSPILLVDECRTDFSVCLPNEYWIGLSRASVNVGRLEQKLPTNKGDKGVDIEMVGFWMGASEWPDLLPPRSLPAVLYCLRPLPLLLQDGKKDIMAI